MVVVADESEQEIDQKRLNLYYCLCGGLVLMSGEWGGDQWWQGGVLPAPRQAHRYCGTEPALDSLPVRGDDKSKYLGPDARYKLLADAGPIVTIKRPLPPGCAGCVRAAAPPRRPV